ncbi:MAG: S1 RNA-binding domain-containing protein [Deltaproteobacteria bacterium]|nr:S1 RNA-binding domain-containing protein [Deltaproteobacteria bacterium]
MTTEDDFAALFAASEATEKQQRQVNLGDVVQGKVIAVGQNSAFVAVGGKGEAVIDVDEFRDTKTGEIGLQVGETIEATVIDDGRRSGSIVLKRTLGRGSRLPSELEQALAHRMAVEGLVAGENKGGFDVQISGVKAFCPWSQIDLRRGPERPAASQFIGQRFRFYVTKIESGGRNIVVSRRELLEEESAALAEKTWEAIKVGAVLRGRVTTLRDFGAFVDLGGVEGLIHISELGYGRFKHPSEVLQIGQEIDVQVLKVDPDSQEGGQRRQISLSLKALAQDPWSTVREQFPVGSTVKGIVRRLEAYGAFVEIAPAVEGLVHVSKLALDRRIAHARQVLNVGQEVEVTILSVDPEPRRLSLSIVEQARRVRDDAVTAEKAETHEVMTKTNQRTTFGSFGDLLAASKKKS